MPATQSLNVEVQYFAILREQRGLAREQLATGAATAGELYRDLAARHALALGPEHLRVAINDEFSAWDAPLAEGDRIVFIPPVAGG
ncbi:MAG TPA: molybdopterin converting factor subunit 1 [Candidatus Sumerlaeota bacterium]|nr:molybdopterin converting factor subunit 1 [Candidatus Sumerlaeota bacterium]HOR29360.1 molybdopterin converting factor subunit 1 [Candidatus Sumerlaeota bacterium]HPK01037.1 molybdopterin converting factor subunit 1 [Candidatus Sumerlaeota bacterium]